MHTFAKQTYYLFTKSKTMITNKVLIAGLLGALVAFVLGWVIWGVLLVNFMEGTSGSATGVMRSDDEMVWWALVLGHLALGMLFALIFSRWAGISTFMTGAKAGAVIGGLMTIFFDMVMLATTHISTPTGAVVDIVASIVSSAITGGVIGWYLGRGEGR